MLKNETIKGNWFLPSNPDEKISGTLYFLPESESTLDLFGAFFKGKNIFIDKDETREIPLICGIDSDGNLMSLIYCYRRNYTHHYRSDIKISSYLVKNVIFRLSLSSLEDKIFSNVSFSFNLMNQWIGENILNESIFYTDQNELDGFQFRFLKSEVKKNWHFNLNENLSIDITPSAWFNNKNPNDIRLFETFRIRVSSKEFLTFEEFRKLAVRFHSFIELAYDEPTFFTYLNLAIPKNSDNKGERLVWHNIYFSQPNINQDFKRALRVRYNHEKIKSNLEEILKNWFSFDQTLEPLIEQLILSYQRENTIQIDFLNITQSLDGFHRRFYSKRRKDFEKRLKALVDSCSKIPNLLFDDSELYRISQNRHYYTHLFEEDNSVLYPLEELYQKTQKLKVLFFCCVMKRIGFSDEMLNWVGADLY